MIRTPDFDLEAVHRHFAAHCFDAAWELMEKAGRTRDDDRAMMALCQASIYHWTQRPDCAQQNLSIGYWQASRIAVLLGRPEEARRHADASLAYTAGLAPFFLGYAHEALVRAARRAGDGPTAEAQLATARAYAGQVADAEERELLERDLAALQS